MGRISKDDQIIAANKEASPHELRILGVSEKKISELIEEENLKAKAKPQSTYNQEQRQKVKPEIQKDTQRATPLIKRPPAPQSDTVSVVEISTGKATPMSRVFAERFIRKNGKTHVIR